MSEPTASPDAEVILWGTSDVAGARIHASDESVDPTEIEQMIVTQAVLLHSSIDEGTL